MVFEWNIIVAVFVLLGIAIFIIGLFINNIISASFVPSVVYDLIRYGRANVPLKAKKSTLPKWIEVPKKWFAHFYLYCLLMQAQVFLLLIALYVLEWNPNKSPTYGVLRSILDVLAGSDQSSLIISPIIALLASFLFLIHISRRYYETNFVCVYSDTKMNVAHYLLGFFHYTGSVLSLAAYFHGFSGKSRPTNSTDHITWDWNEAKGDIGVLQILGVALFLYGNVQQYKAHSAYANLRKKGDKVVTQKHQIPRGGLFELVSCPNYWAEILIYIAFALIFSFQNPCWNAVLFWVIANQISSGVMNHIWYKEKFPEYPKNRKAVIPYVW